MQVIKTYVCDECNAHYDEWEDALECESNHYDIDDLSINMISYDADHTDSGFPSELRVRLSANLFPQGSRRSHATYKLTSVYRESN